MTVQQPDPRSAEAALQTVRTLHCIILNGDEDRWITRDTAQAWLNELRVVQGHLERYAAVEAERDQAREIVRMFARDSGYVRSTALCRLKLGIDPLPDWLTDGKPEVTR